MFDWYWHLLLLVAGSQLIVYLKAAPVVLTPPPHMMLIYWKAGSIKLPASGGEKNLCQESSSDSPDHS
jgi:hypothetical protein